MVKIQIKKLAGIPAIEFKYNEKQQQQKKTLAWD